METKDYQAKSNLQIFIYYLKKHKALFFLDMCCAFLVAAIDLIYPYVSRMAMYTLLPSDKYKSFFVVMGIVALAYLLRSFLYFVVTYWGHRFGVLVEADIRLDLFKHIQSLEFGFFDHSRVGQLMSRITSDLFEIVELAHHGPEDILIAVVTITGSLIFVSRIELRLSLLLSALIPLCLIVLLCIRSRQRRAAAAVKENNGKINARIEASLSGIKSSKAFANEKTDFMKFEESVEEYKDVKKDFYRCMAFFNSSMEFFCCIISVVVMTVGGCFIMKGEMSYIDLVTFCLYINTFITPIRKLVNFAESFASGSAGLSRFADLMRLEPEIKDSSDAKELEIKDGCIEFKDLSFKYKQNEKVLKDINLKIEGGAATAVVGPSGGGKTSLCRLIPRFYDPLSGEVIIDGQNVKDIKADSLHRQIGIVQQEVFLFPGSILENIRYGRIDASDEEVFEAARRAEIYADVLAMPEGFNTYVGERGALLSGGQKQRIAIARIFLKNPPILILDEATSALDSINEAKIQNAFDELSIGRTCLIIAHRLSAIRKAKRIVVIDDGQIKEDGTHEELLSLNGIYSNMYKTQMTG